MGQVGTIPISRLAAPDPQLPASQGYISIASFPPRPRLDIPGPPLNHTAPAEGIGVQFAPGQGGDTPGGGGGAQGDDFPVETSWFVDGYVVSPAVAHQPGTRGYQGARRSGA